MCGFTHDWLADTAEDKQLPVKEAEREDSEKKQREKKTHTKQSTRESITLLTPDNNKDYVSIHSFIIRIHYLTLLYRTARTSPVLFFLKTTALTLQRRCYLETGVLHNYKRIIDI